MSRRIQAAYAAPVRKSLASALIGAAVLISGCATPAPSERLQAARESVEEVRQDPEVARSAAEALDRARRALEEAERLFDEGADTQRVDHYAYLAGRYAEIAQEEAQQARLQDQVEGARERRQQVRLELQQQEAQQLQQELADLKARQTERGVVLTLGDVLFDFDEATLKPGGERAAARLAQFMREYPQRRIRVEGHTDSVGPASYNQALSRRRAEAVKQAITTRGIDPSRIIVEGYGEQYPVASNDNEAGRQRNRRVEVVISDPEGEVEGR